VDFTGKIYVLVDRANYSSAEKFCVFCKATEWATLIGEETGGDGIGFDPIFISLPNSGLLVRFPAGMGLNPSGRANEEYHTMPDIKTGSPLEKTLDIIEKESD
jgi:C-terminal processing protease CtpA/Prc